MLFAFEQRNSQLSLFVSFEKVTGDWRPAELMAVGVGSDGGGYSEKGGRLIESSRVLTLNLTINRIPSYKPPGSFYKFDSSCSYI